MWKVSFKDPMYKKVQKFNDRATVVTLKGDLKIPMEVMHSMPKKMWDWMTDKINPRVKVYHWQGIISVTVTGKAIRSEKDKDDPVLAERIAECRAKIKLYKFIYTLLMNYTEYYATLLKGKEWSFENTPVNDANCIAYVYNKYTRLYLNEKKHLAELLKEHD
jgi:hypothetical protein